ncbi:unnamed protein product, partial [Amoebophrya sp. A25]
KLECSGSEILLLGLLFNLEGRPSVRISPERAELYRKLIVKRLESGRLSQSQAAELCGRLSFSFCAV